MNWVVQLFFILLIIDLFAVAFLFINRKKIRDKKYSMSRYHDYQFIKTAPEKMIIQRINLSWKKFLFAYQEVLDYFTLPEAARIRVAQSIKKTGTLVRIYRLLNSKNPLKRKTGAHFLGTLGGHESGPLLVQLLKREKLYSVKLVIINTIIDLDFHVALPDIIDCLIDAPKRFQEQISRMAWEFGQAMIHYIPILEHRPEREIKLFLINYGENCPSLPLFEFLNRVAHENDSKLSRKAFSLLLTNYRKKVLLMEYINHHDLVIRRMAVEALGSDSSDKTTTLLLKFLENDTMQNAAVIALSKQITEFPHQSSVLLKIFNQTSNSKIQSGLARAFSNHIDYFLYRINSVEKKSIQKLIISLIEQGYSSGLISFLNANRDNIIEDLILEPLAIAMKGNSYLEDELSLYLNEAVLKKIGLKKKESKITEPPRKGSLSLPLLLFFLFLSLSILPAIFFSENSVRITELEFIEWIKIFLLRANYYFIFFSVAVNSIYLLLLVFSFFGVKKLQNQRKIKSRRFLYKEGILPPISIIGPAYCEEATIIDSVKSLLNLDYPEYEVIIVNDGSKDRTLELLIENFDLDKVDLFYRKTLTTKLIKGIYKSRQFPRLTIIDKRNGGKADSINAGINLSSGKYCCVIDADCVLESEALIESASQFLDEEEDVTASGGIILPINGCDVQKGHIKAQHVARRGLAAFQTIEYFRAFIAGRIGWSVLKALPIISGAFGLFNRKDLLYARGYLTSGELFRKDTVGEDMELIFRLVRLGRRKGRKKANILYCPYSVCWTEVPESMTSLLSQRKRWQRGLIETLSLHRNFLFNPRFGSYGLLAFPYFLIFELIGAWIEFQGYIFFFSALVLGLLSPLIIVLIFMSTIFLGIIISIGSMVLTDRVGPFFSNKDILFLLLICVIENFGFRQLMSFTRIQGFISTFKSEQKWGEMIRRGFGKE